MQLLSDCLYPLRSCHRHNSNAGIVDHRAISCFLFTSFSASKVSWTTNGEDEKRNKRVCAPRETRLPSIHIQDSGSDCLQSASALKPTCLVGCITLHTRKCQGGCDRLQHYNTAPQLRQFLCIDAERHIPLLEKKNFYNSYKAAAD